MGNSALQRQESLVSQAMKKKHALPEWATSSEYANLDSLQKGLRKAGLESSNLIVAVDFTKSNMTQGSTTNGGTSLHAISETRLNPYETVLDIMGKTMSPFDDDNLIPAFYFGDSKTRHNSTASFLNEDQTCHGMDQVLREYRHLAQRLDFSGPTSFGPVIDAATEIVENSGNGFHILVIVADGQVSTHLNCLKETRASLIRASRFPLAVVIVGVGDGPFEEMDVLDDDLPDRLFDNCQFIEFSPFQAALERGEAKQVVEAAFAVCTLQEIPMQYRMAADLGLLEAPSQRSQTDGGRRAARHAAIADNIHFDTMSSHFKGNRTKRPLHFADDTNGQPPTGEGTPSKKPRA